MFYGRKPCDIQCRRMQYQNHIKKLQAVKSGKLAFHRSLSREWADVQGWLKKSHQMHNTSLKEQFKRREMTELETHRRSYNNVRSIVKSEVNRRILPLPARHKPNTYFLDVANLQLIGKIVNAKSQFDFKKLHLEKLATARVKNDTSEDYSQIYHNSFLNHQKPRQICLRMGRQKHQHRIAFRFLSSDLFQGFRRDALFALELEVSSRSKQSKLFALEEILESQVQLGFSGAAILHFLEKIGQRMVRRFRLTFLEEELAEEKVWASKVIEDNKNRTIGVVELEVKKKKHPHKTSGNLQVTAEEEREEPTAALANA